MVAIYCSLPIQVVIVAADPTLRAELRVRLHQERDYIVVGEADDVFAGRTLVDRLGPAVLIIDGDLPAEAGLPLVEELAMRTPSIGSIVLTERVASKGLLFAALGHMAAGYAAAAVDGQTLGELVRRVARGERPIDDIFLDGCAIPGARPHRAPPARDLRRPTTSVDNRVVAGANDFAFVLFTALRLEASGNLLFSPCSIMLALAMAHAGACGETAEQMAAVIQCDLPQSALHAALGELQADMLARANNGDSAGPDQPAAVCPSPTRSGESRPIPSARRTLRCLTGRTAPECTRPTSWVLPMWREHRSTVGLPSKRRAALRISFPRVRSPQIPGWFWPMRSGLPTTGRTPSTSLTRATTRFSSLTAAPSPFR